MSDETPARPSISGSIPAGWYPDPAGGAGKRWWDGSVWTANMQEPEAAPAPPSFGNYTPANLRPAAPLPTVERGIAYTRASWWIAGSPFWVVVPQVTVVEIFNLLAPLPVPTLVLAIILLTTVAWGILLALAFSDRKGLFEGGNDSAASPWWTLLTPLAYLIARARSVQLYAIGGWASVVWWCLAAILTPGVSVLAVFAVYGLVGN